MNLFELRALGQQIVGTAWRIETSVALGLPEDLRQDEIMVALARMVRPITSAAQTYVGSWEQHGKNALYDQLLRLTEDLFARSRELHNVVVVSMQDVPIVALEHHLMAANFNIATAAVYLTHAVIAFFQHVAARPTMAQSANEYLHAANLHVNAAETSYRLYKKQPVAS